MGFAAHTVLQHGGDLALVRDRYARIVDLDKDVAPRFDERDGVRIGDAHLHAFILRQRRRASRYRPFQRDPLLVKGKELALDRTFDLLFLIPYAVEVRAKAKHPGQGTPIVAEKVA